jgi:pimeloyl-ACP methyl ester carboxylesterase
LLLHGFPQTHLCWDLVAPALAENHTVIAPDLRGVTGTEESQLDDAPAIWRFWAAQVSAGRVPGGHFPPEEAPGALLALLARFLLSD